MKGQPTTWVWLSDRYLLPHVSKENFAFTIFISNDSLLATADICNQKSNESLMATEWLTSGRQTHFPDDTQIISRFYGVDLFRDG